MIIKDANLSDARVLSELAIETYSVAFGHSFIPSDLASHLERNLSVKAFERILKEDVVLVAETKDRIVGFLQFGRIQFVAKGVFTNDKELRRLYVHPEYQNRGIGTLLMDAALDHPALRDSEDIFLDVWEHNHDAQRFYARFGFEVIGERKFFVESGAETSLDLIMVRRRSGHTRPQSHIDLAR